MKRVPWGKVVQLIIIVVALYFHAVFSQVYWALYDADPVYALQGQIALMIGCSTTILSLAILPAVVIGWWNERTRNIILAVVVCGIVAIWVIGIRARPMFYQRDAIKIGWVIWLLSAWRDVWT